MNGKFFDLKKEKQDRIMNAALKVFALNGYKRASTDDVVAEAGISKGLLFYYFENKIGLYTFLYDYSVRYMMMELESTVDTKETELFQVIKNIEYARMLVLRNYPYMQQFLNRVATENVSEALLAIEEKRNRFSEGLEKFYSQIDYSDFSSVEEGGKVVKIMDFMIKGLMSEHMEEGSYNPEMLYEEVSSYLELCKRLLKKE